MKLRFGALILLISSGTTIQGNAWASASQTTFSGGMMHFSGSLTDGPCAVKATNGDRIVTLKQVKESALLVPGQAAGQVRLFHVVLDDCNINVYSNAQVSFSGETDSTFKTVLVNQATDDPAENVGLQLYGPDGEKIVPDNSSAIKLTDGFNMIPLTVDYVPTRLNPTGGNVTSTVTFSIIYS